MTSKLPITNKIFIKVELLYSNWSKTKKISKKTVVKNIAFMIIDFKQQIYCLIF